MQIRGRGVITEYAENGPPGAIDPDGWLDTGDLGHLDQDGYLFLAGRSDDVINRGGEKIYPREIEDVLLAQPGVRSAAVVAAHDDVLGERPVAYVVPAGPWPGELADAVVPAGPWPGGLADALRAACEAALPRAKRPTAFCLVPELPLGPTGKVARRRLQELGLQELGLQELAGKVARHRLQELGQQELTAAHHALPSSAPGGGGHRRCPGRRRPPAARRGSSARLGPQYVGAALLGPEFVGAALLGPQYVGAALLGPEYVGAALLGPQFVGAALLGPEYVGAALLGVTHGHGIVRHNDLLQRWSRPVLTYCRGA